MANGSIFDTLRGQWQCIPITAACFNFTAVLKLAYGNIHIGHAICNRLFLFIRQ